MDWTLWICFLVCCTPGLIAGEQKKLNLTFDIWEGNVTVLWDPPNEAPVPAFYQVKLALDTGPHAKWNIVQECDMITETKCNLGNFIFKPTMKVKIELISGNNESSWLVIRRIRLDDIKLLSPDFDLFSGPNTVKVKIHRKPFLKELFPYGLSYSAILYPRGQESKAKTLSDDDDEDGEVEFTDLSYWQAYCVRVRLKITSIVVSNTSLPRCIHPPTDLSVVISIGVIGVVGVITLFMLFVCFFLRRPGKMPAVLKLAVNGWLPMNVGQTEVESVTQKGWLLNSNKIAEKTKAFDEIEELSEDEKERRESTDSGVSIGQQDSIKNRPQREEDSGCGSLTGTEDSLSSGRRSLEELPFLDGGGNSSSVEGTREDSGLGIQTQDISDKPKPMHDDLLSEIVVIGDGYRSQSPSAEAETETTIQCDEDANMVSRINGYRSGQVTCLCSDSETCMWCKTRKHLTDCDSFSHEQTVNDNDRSSYLKKSPLETVNMFGLDDLSCHSDKTEESSLFITCPLLLKEPYKLDTLPLTLGDVELTFT